MKSGICVLVILNGCGSRANAHGYTVCTSPQGEIVFKYNALEMSSSSSTKDGEA